MKTALVQMCSGDNPQANLALTKDFIAEAASQGAGFILTPEVTNIISGSRTHQNEVLQHQDDDLTLAGLRMQAADLGIWLSIGSLALKTDDADGRYANRSFLIAPDGTIRAWYDKIHMFDVQVTATETFRESAGYRPGTRAVVADTPFGSVGLSICYDVRFGYLHRALAQAGAEILTIPAAFSPATGKHHWQPLLQARAIETGSYVLAAAQTGTHNTTRGPIRQTYGHSMAISPWGEVLLDAGTEPGIHIFEMDDTSVAAARRKVPALTHDRTFDGP
ncbi:MAG: carbon-nitrogen hydrolase family protein [Rhodobacteraceae bacterium]|nr:carbon-nitrogen hydrolase family protein [Paracoccaceae bacterium]